VGGCQYDYENDMNNTADNIYSTVSPVRKTFSNQFYVPYVSSNFVSDSFLETLLGIGPTLQGDSRMCAFNFDIEGGLSGALRSSLSVRMPCAASLMDEYSLSTSSVSNSRAPLF